MLEICLKVALNSSINGNEICSKMEFGVSTKA
jgi:hypothetical protein